MFSEELRILDRIITGDENLLNIFLTRKQALYAGTDIYSKRKKQL